jgi:hypothetical protein
VDTVIDDCGTTKQSAAKALRRLGAVAHGKTCVNPTAGLQLGNVAEILRGNMMAIQLALQKCSSTSIRISGGDKAAGAARLNFAAGANAAHGSLLVHHANCGNLIGAGATALLRGAWQLWLRFSKGDSRCDSTPCSVLGTARRTTSDPSLKPPQRCHAACRGRAAAASRDCPPRCCT